ncbi:class I SAM-dependent methyltransferase [Acerihabitans sp. TG2]|uniref:class I SAM-dependent methyltransferase n=1 Tax=Acerihabitans sp. TG2 TaxID=3096008 RepID=UPI002B22DEE0|nr:class I SAM-dependent methyltransferase [Acerihabitans sp. TG2]MEA9392085.1 class I SAM-dependent methyltransferase [Acerihabitans sp. TG2]
MNVYEQRYRVLKAEDSPAWTGDGYERAWGQLNKICDTLEAGHWLPPAGATFLELGCGNGAMSSQLMAYRGYQVSGVDISATAIQWATERFTSRGLKGVFTVGDVCHLSPFPSDSFDIIFDGSCLHCIQGADRLDCLGEMKRLLNADGVVVISSMCGIPKQAKDSANFNPHDYLLMQEGLPWRTIKPLALLKQEIINAGFAIVFTDVQQNPWWDHATLVCRKSR